VIAVSRSNRHPSFNVVYVDDAGEVRLVMPSENKGACRQDFPSVYDISTAFFITSPHFIMHADSLWGGRVGALEILAEHAVDIDEQLDFEFAEFLLQKRVGAQSNMPLKAHRSE
jgi:N-acylneuraminate cytidylyltransferase